TDTFTVTSQDGTATGTVTVTITGTNDNPVAVADATAVKEDTNTLADPNPVSGNVLGNDTDVDSTDTHTVSAVNGLAGNVGTDVAGTYGTLHLNSDGSYTYTLDNSKASVQALAEGVTVTDVFSYTNADNHGGSSSSSLTVTITGTNDAPDIHLVGSGTPDTASATLTETNAGLTATGTLTVTDADVADTVNSSITTVAASGTTAGLGLTNAQLLAMLTVSPTSGLAANPTDTHNLTWNFNSGTQAFDYLGAGQALTLSYTVQSTDNHSTSDIQTVAVTINGANDAPVIDLNGASVGNSTSLSYTAGSAATVIAPAAAITDVDSPDFGGGSLTVAFTANGTSADQLSIQNQGTGTGQIGLSGSNVTYGGVVIGTFAGGTNGSNLVITFNASTTQAAAAALADHILYSNATSASIAKTVTYTLVDGDGTANGGTDTSTASATINVTGSDTTPPSVSISHQLLPSHQQSTFTVHATDPSGIQSVQILDSVNGGPPTVIYTFTAAELQAAVNGNYIHTFTDGQTPFTLINNDTHQLSARVVDNATNVGTALDPVTFNTNGGNQSNTKFSAPAGTAGEPINLALTDPSDGQTVTVTVKGVPSGWALDGATQNADGSWTVQSNAVHGLTVTTPADFAGAVVLDVSMTWTNADGTTGSLSIADNVEVYAPGSPIFAWSGDDVLTGSSGHDLFVFSQPIGNDTVHSFDAAADQVDLVGYSGVQSFADVQAHMADDANGNAVITFGDGQSITLEGVHSSALGAGNFAFDQTPVVNNAGTMIIGDGALLPLSGTVNNSGLISLNSTGSETLLQGIQHGVTLQGGGQVVLSDSALNIVSGTGPDVTLTNVDNTISGAGQLGDGMLGLDNRGIIIASGSNALVIDTGGSVVANSGTLEATGSGGLIVAGGVANSGMLWANGGNIAIHGAVTGEGDATIGNLSKLEFGAASSTDVTFAQNAAGTLELDDSFDFSGRIGGITNDDKLDLNDILFGSATKALYQANADGSGGTLTVTDGTHGATLHLLGSYDANGFNVADDGQGHTVVTYNPAEFTLTGVGNATSEFAV
ncbi:adhesin, partial [Mesorhizobium sp. B4-1-3]|uniref:beta strand repeat-containing protein n=1 Tax=Mesorhizobium sp. B4-1-3 TaxID=2589889 RepID=UPI00112BABAC